MKWFYCYSFHSNKEEEMTWSESLCKDEDVNEVGDFWAITYWWILIDQIQSLDEKCHSTSVSPNFFA